MRQPFPLQIFIFIAVIASVAILPADAGELHVLAGAGLRQPVDQLAREFTEQTGHRVATDFGGSGQLLAKIKAASRGDIFIPGALFYIEKLKAADKVQSQRSIVYHTPVIGVNVKQKAKITRFEDLAEPGLRLAMGDPKAMAFGRTAETICEKSGRKAEIDKNVVVYGATVKQLALYVAQGNVDAAIIGRADAVQNRDRIAMVTIPEAYYQPEVIAAAVLKSAKDPDLARQLCDFFSSEHGVEVFQTHGFLPLKK